MTTTPKFLGLNVDDLPKNLMVVIVVDPHRGEYQSHLVRRETVARIVREILGEGELPCTTHPATADST